MELRIVFCKTLDGVRIAYSTVGQGSPFVISPGWISHLQMNWGSPKEQALLSTIERE